MLFFATRHRDNIVLAYDRRAWAVNKPSNPDQMFNRALQVKPGTLAFFWVTKDSPYEPSNLMMPSIITSVPDIKTTLSNDPWEGEWCCPFSIQPLFRYNKRPLGIEKMRKILGNNMANKLRIPGNFVFMKPSLEPEEIQAIVQHFFDE